MMDFGVKPWEMNRFRPYELDALERFVENATAENATAENATAEAKEA